MVAWRERIQLRLPCSVLISPLCAMYRNGCARSHDRERVRGEALVREAQRRGEALVAEVAVERADLLGEQHPLVDDGAVRERRHVEFGCVAEPQRADRVAGGLAHDVELALERVAIEAAAPRADEHLADHGHGAPRGLAQRGVVHRHVAPAEQRLALVDDGALDLAHAGRLGGAVARQEDHADAVGSRLGQLRPAPGHLLAEERVGNLHQQPGAVAVQRIGAGGAAVAQVVEDGEALLHDFVRLAALDVRDEAHAARVVLVARVVEALFRRPAGLRIHTGTCSIMSPHPGAQHHGSRVPQLTGNRKMPFGLVAPAAVLPVGLRRGS